MTWLALGLIGVGLLLILAYALLRYPWDGEGPCPVCATRAAQRERQRLAALGDCPEHRSWRGER